MTVPEFGEFFNPSLKALRDLGGSASIRELDEHVAQHFGLSEEELAEGEVSGRPLFNYRMAWTRTYLKEFGLIENSARGIWSLPPKGSQTPSVDPEEVKKQVRRQHRQKRKERGKTPDPIPPQDSSLDNDWKADLIDVLLKLKPDQFERLCQRLLRESGFTQVEVTGRSGDGGIDGTGSVKIGDLLSFPILFQCKKYEGSVSPATVRDFRGAMTGRADRGLILTTGRFTREACREAARDGAPPIDLVDRELLLEKLKELRLGVSVELVEDVTIDPEWYHGI